MIIQALKQKMFSRQSSVCLLCVRVCVCVPVHNAVVTAAVFAPNPSFIFRMAMGMADNSATAMCFDDDTEDREIIVSADFTGAIKVITNRPKS